jgi:lipopolysaccharide/colanic/teichoic acid biosynthesis glycosyltransferase
MALVNRRYAPLWSGLPLDSMYDIPCCSVPVARGRYLNAKQLLDRVLGAVLLVLSLPLLAILVLAVRLSSRGPAIYRQTRVGLGGRIFTMYKLRSMRTDAEAASGPRWASSGNDPRVTPLGYWLRRLHLDELPQLFNLVRGEMSLVGPRPERPEFVSILSQQIPGYLDRLRVMPGITGLAQVNLPPDTDLDSVRRKLLLDLEYIRSASPHLDLRLIGCTALRLVGLRGGMTVAWLGLQRTVPDANTSAEVLHDSPITPTALAASEDGRDRYLSAAEASHEREPRGTNPAERHVGALVATRS